MDVLEQAMYLHGVGSEFTKYTGEHVYFSHDTRKQALRCCDIDVSDIVALSAHNFEHDIAKWLKPVTDVSLVKEKDFRLSVRVPESDLDMLIGLEIPSLQINLQQKLIPDVLGDYRYNDIRYVEVGLHLPSIPIGYHNAKLTFKGEQFPTELWIVPSEAFGTDDGDKRVGLSIQLYSLNEKGNLGIGDFGDLKQLIQQSRGQLDYILLNPLHELFEDQPERASPYSPNHRCFLNPLYINLVEAVALATTDTGTQLSRIVEEASQTIKRASFIDYSEVSKIKYEVLGLLYRDYLTWNVERKERAYNEFLSYAVVAASEINEHELTQSHFYQWLAHKQLYDCQTMCERVGMGIGLINDLAVGCANDGEEFREYRHLFANGANVGAPPDPWAEDGQDWGLPALDTKHLSLDNYAYFRRLIKSNMKGVGGLRIDHVMAIRRLWWCFTQEDGHRTGCYMYYPFEHLLSILLIESQLNNVMLIGEDLGIVPEEVRAALKESGIFSNILFYFEKDHLGQFVNPITYRTESLLMIANHDVPPFYGWWQSRDIELRYEYSLINDQKKDELLQERQLEIAKLCTWIHQHSGNQVTALCSPELVYEVLLKILAKSNARLLTVQLDDLDEATVPVNMPGTNLEFPNWRRKLNHSVEDIFNKKLELLKEVKELRTLNG